MPAPTQQTLAKACAALSLADPALARAHTEIGLPTWRTRPAAYETIATVIAYQQISTRAAASIWARVTGGLGTITPQTLLDTEEDRLRSFGLSRPKVAHLKSVANAVDTGALDLAALPRLPADEARAHLIAVKGIGPWTAELYLLYVLGEVDAFPTADLGLMEAYKRLSDAETRLDKAAFTAQGEAWRPWRGVAAHLLWDWLNAERAKA